MDNIVYLITHNGVDGRGKTEITQAYYSREERDKVFSQLKFQGYYSQRDKIIQEDKAMKETISKLNGIDRLLLDIGQEHLILKEDK